MIGAMKRKTAIAFSVAALVPALAAAKGEVRRSDRPFFNPPMSAPLRSGLSELRVSGSTGVTEGEWIEIAHGLKEKGASVVRLSSDPAAEPGPSAAGPRALFLDADSPGKPDPADVDRFVEFMRERPEGEWVHVRGGESDAATTAFMAMADMMKNARGVPFKDILRRQSANGGTDLLDAGKSSRFASRDRRQLRAFLRLFHEYARKNADGFATPWSDWEAIKASGKGRR